MSFRLKCLAYADFSKPGHTTATVEMMWFKKRSVERKVVLNGSSSRAAPVSRHRLSLMSSGFHAKRRTVSVVLHLQSLEFGFDGFDDFRVEAPLHFDSLDTVMCQKDSTTEDVCVTYGFRTHCAHFSCPHPGHCGEPSRKVLSQCSHSHRTRVRGFRHMRLDLSSSRSISVSLSYSTSPG